MQFKLLQFYKVLSNFSTSLISAFVPLLIYQQTGSVTLAVLYLVVQNATNVVFNILFKKWLFEKPQLMLMLRIIPIIIMQVLLVFLDVAPLWAGIGCGVFTGLNYVLKYTPSDVIFAYATPPDAGPKMLAFSRLSEEIGYVAAGVLGGLFLDYIDYTIVIAISLSLYFVSSLPLVVFYIKNRKQESFNTEHVSNAHVHFESKVQDGRGKKVCRKMWWGYFIEYALMSGIDAFYAIFGFLVYLKSGSFLLSGILNSIFDTLYGASSMLVGKLDEKYDITKISAISICVMGAIGIALTLTAGSVVSFVLYEVVAFLWPFATIFVHQHMLIKAKILGMSNDVTYAKQLGTVAGNTVFFAFGFISVIGIGISSALATIGCGVFTPVNEEVNRQALVDYLENNEIAEQPN